MLDSRRSSFLAATAHYLAIRLQLRILNGVVSLLTTEVHNKALASIFERTEWRERES